MSKTTKSISIVTILVIIVKLIGFIREMIIASYYGATYQTDAYNTALFIVRLSTIIISSTIVTVIIPMYNHRQIQQSKAEADLFTNNILWITSLFYVVLSVIGIIFAPTLVKIFAPNFNTDTTTLTIHILRLIFIFTVATNIAGFLTSIAQIHGKFAIPVIATLPVNVFSVLSVVLFADKIGIYALIVGYMFLIMQVIILALSVRRIFKLKAVLNFTNGDLKDVVKLSLPLYISVAVWEINALIGKILASGLSEGSISAMTYASRLRGLPDEIVTASILTVVFPLLAKYAARGEFGNIKATVIKTISLLFMVLLPVIAVSVYYSQEITKIIYERGTFASENTVLTANIFTFTVISLIFSGCANLFNNLFYSIQDTKTPQIAAFAMLIFNIAFNLILVRYMQVSGIALATSIASFIYFMILFIQFRLKFGSIGGLSLLKDIFKYFIAIVGVIPVFLLFELLRNKLPLFIFFAATTTFSLCIYALLLYLLKVELFMEVWNLVRKRIVGRRINNDSVK